MRPWMNLPRGGEIALPRAEMPADGEEKWTEIALIGSSLPNFSCAPAQGAVGFSRVLQLTTIWELVILPDNLSNIACAKC